MNTTTLTLDKAPYINRAFVLEKCNNFVDFQLWPLKSALDPERWLQNFYERELEHALHLLNAFMYYSQPLTEQLFLSGFQNISANLRTPGDDYAVTTGKWEAFKTSLIVTYVTGERPSPTDSGQMFSRMARKVLGIQEQQIFNPEHALAEAARAPARPVLFVDDFVGSGNQFVETWDRKYDIQGAKLSFRAHAARHTHSKFFYTPAVATSFGIGTIAMTAPQVVISPGNTLPPENNAVAPDSNIWPEKLAASGPQFIEAVSRRAGIKDLGGKVGDWRGFNKLGLCIAFSHSTPDASLPLFYWDENGWIPLVRRT